MSASVRELAQRRSGTDEVLLLWYPDDQRVEIFVRDVATGVGFHLEIPPARAIDAFYHPYWYAACQRPGRVLGAAAVSSDA
jgi:hypothetical protein